MNIGSTFFGQMGTRLIGLAWMGSNVFGDNLWQWMVMKQTCEPGKPCWQDSIDFRMKAYNEVKK